MKYLSSELKKFLKFASGFVVFLSMILFISERTLAYLVAHSTSSQTGKVNLIMKQNIDADLMIFGSSVAEVGFDATILEKELEISAYNMAIDGTPITGSEYLLNQFLDYSQNCKTIVIGLAFFSLGYNQQINSPERFLAHRANRYIKDNFKAVSPSLYYKLYFIPFYSFIVANHIYYKNAFMGLKNILIESALDRDPLKGFVPHDSKYQDTRKDFKNLDKIGIHQKSIETFESVLKKIKAKGITPVLVITPMYIDGQESFSNYQEYLNEVKDLSNKSDVILFDFSTHDIAYDKDNFYNNGHLNTIGSSKFTNSISDSLALNIF